MQKATFFLFILFFISYNSVGQITKDNWLVGGSGSFSSQKEHLISTDVRGLNIRLSPNIGYFFIDKFAGGIRLTFNHNKIKFNGGVGRSTQTGLGPYIRYYFLNEDKRLNFFAETAYQYLHSKGGNGASDKQNNFSFSAGPVFYFNSSVGFELILNYELINTPQGTNAKTFSVGFGFQIHLEKSKN